VQNGGEFTRDLGIARHSQEPAPCENKITIIAGMIIVIDLWGLSWQFCRNKKLD